MERRLAAIFAADVVGYSRLMSADEAGVLTRVKALHRELIEPKILERKGRIVKLMGDGLLAEFSSVVEAVQCAVDIQRSLAGNEADLPEDRRLRLRIGINLGDIIVDDSDIYGDGVNVAARLEGLADPGGVCISGPAFDTVDGKLGLDFEDIGERQVKNIARPVRVYRLASIVGQKAPGALRQEPPAVPDKPSIAVLPFSNMSGDPEQQYFSNGVTEDITTALSRLRWLFVIASNSTIAYAGEAHDTRRITGELGVRYLLVGSVRRLGARVRVTARLMDGADGNHLWADRFDRTIEDIFDLQDEITTTIVGIIAPEIGSAEVNRARRKTAHDLDAWDRCLLASQNVRERNRDGLEMALKLYSEAIESNGRFVPAYVGLAHAHGVSVLYRLDDDREGALEAAFKAAQRAVALDRRDASAHTMLGRVFDLRGQFDDSIREHRVALELDPNSATGHMLLASAYSHSDDPARAIPQANMALRLSPRDPDAWFMHLIRSLALSRLGHHDEAIEASAMACHYSSVDFWPFLGRAVVLAQGGNLPEALNAFQEAQNRWAGISIAYIETAFSNTGPGYRSHLVDGLRKLGLTQ